MKVGFIKHKHLNQHLENMSAGLVLWADSPQSPIVYTGTLTSEQGRKVEGARIVEKDEFREGTEP